MGVQGSKLGYVLMEKEGAHGNFNRAQRSLMVYHESFPTVALLYVAASWVFPVEALVVVSIWAISRIASSVGYRESAEGRMSGVIPGHLAIGVLQGMVGIAAWKSF